MLSPAATFLRRASVSLTSSSKYAKKARVATSAMGTVRNLNVHEYISMEIMNQHGIATPKGFVANTPEEAEHIFTTMMNKRTLISCNDVNMRASFVISFAHSILFLTSDSFCDD